MNFFQAVKNATFASKLFAALPGFDFDAALKANNENALKAHLDSALVAAKPGEPTADQTRLIAEAVSENSRISTELAQAKKDLEAITAGRAALAALHEPLVAALGGAGVKFDACLDKEGKFSAAQFKAAHDLHVATLVRTECAKVGVKPIADEVTSAAAAAAPVAKKPGEGLTGSSKVTAIFAASPLLAARAAK